MSTFPPTPLCSALLFIYWLANRLGRSLICSLLFQSSPSHAAYARSHAALIVHRGTPCSASQTQMAGWPLALLGDNKRIQWGIGAGVTYKGGQEGIFDFSWHAMGKRGQRSAATCTAARGDRSEGGGGDVYDWQPLSPHMGGLLCGTLRDDHQPDVWIGPLFTQCMCIIASSSAVWRTGLTLYVWEQCPPMPHVSDWVFNFFIFSQLHRISQSSKSHTLYGCN